MSAALLALLGLTLSQEPQPKAPLLIPPTVAQMVMVDAFVVDRKGRPIKALRAEDFELLEDGKRVPIAAFQSPLLSNPEANPSRPNSTSIQPGPVASDVEAATLVIYIDRWLLSPGGRRRALGQVVEVAAGHLRRGARVLIVADDKGLRPLTPITRNLEEIRGAIDRIQGWATTSPSEADTRSTLDNMRSIIEVEGCLPALPQLISLVRGYAMVRAIEARQAGDRLTFLVNALLGLSGRKSLVYISEGLEQRPGIQLFDQITQICPEVLNKEGSQVFAAMQELDTSATLREVVARANAARVTLYPLDARGLTTYSSADISQPFRAYVPSAKNDMVRHANLTSPLHLLGEETGGFALLNGLDPKTAMKRFDADEAGHYIVGFVPGEADGKVHRLSVRLNDKAESKHRANIRHRQAYLRAELPARRGQRSLATLLFGLEENGLDAEVSVERAGPGTALVRVSVPLSVIHPWPDQHGKEARVQVVISLRQKGGERNPVTVKEKDVTFSLDPEALSHEGDRREIVVEVPVNEGEYEFAIGIEDVASGSSTYVRRFLGPG